MFFIVNFFHCSGSAARAECAQQAALESSVRHPRVCGNLRPPIYYSLSTLEAPRADALVFTARGATIASLVNDRFFL